MVIGPTSAASMELPKVRLLFEAAEMPRHEAGPPFEPLAYLGKSRWTGRLAFLKSHYFDHRRSPAVLTTPAKAH